MLNKVQHDLFRDVSNLLRSLANVCENLDSILVDIKSLKSSAAIKQLEAEVIPLKVPNSYTSHRFSRNVGSSSGSATTNPSRRTPSNPSAHPKRKRETIP